MNKGLIVIIIGFLGCAAGFGVLYHARTSEARALMRQPRPEMAWLKKEFNLSEADYARIVELHAQYLPACAERCRKIEEHTARLKNLVSQNAEVTPEIEELMATRAKMRSDCEAEMLKHFIAVSRTMPPEQGRRYLQWIEEQTIFSGVAMERQHHGGGQTCPHEH